MSEDGSTMNETAFWQIIEASREAARKETRFLKDDGCQDNGTANPSDGRSPARAKLNRIHERELEKVLVQLSLDDIVAFDRIFWHFYTQAYRWDLWAAAHWLHGGCSEEGFTDFISCLISLGRARYAQALENPDSLADVYDQPDTPYMMASGFHRVAGNAYREKTKMPRLESLGISEPGGERFDFDDAKEMAKRLPSLVGKYPKKEATGNQDDQDAWTMKAPMLETTTLIIEPLLSREEFDALSDKIFDQVNSAIDKAIEGLPQVKATHCHSFIDLDPEQTNCFKCEHCGRWATNIEKPNEIQGLPSGYPFEGMLVCDECRCWKYDPKYGWADTRPKDPGQSPAAQA